MIKIINIQTSTGNSKNISHITSPYTSINTKISSIGSYRNSTFLNSTFLNSTAGKQLFNFVHTNTHKKKYVVFYIKAQHIVNIEEYYNNFQVCNKDIRYSVILRLCYINKSDITDWRTLGEQIYYIYNDQTSFELKVKSIMTTLLGRLEYILEKYNIENNEVLGIQFLIYEINYNNIIIKKANNKKLSLSGRDLGNQKDLVNISKISKDLSLFNTTSNLSRFGTPLVKQINNGVVENVISLDGNIINLQNFLHELNNIKPYTNDYNFYQSNINDKILYTTVKTLCENNKTINNIRVYNDAGIEICDMVDTVAKNCIDNFTRTVGNVTLHLNKNGIYNKEITQKFNPIKPKKVTGYLNNMHYSDYKFGTLDLETYVDKNGISKTYAIGFYAKDDLNTYYINETLDSEELIMRCIDSMLKEKYNRYSFYVHNLGRFDATFILKVIIKAHEKEPNKYKFDLILKDSIIICLSITKTIRKSAKLSKSYTIKIIDS